MSTGAAIGPLSADSRTFSAAVPYWTIFADFRPIRGLFRPSLRLCGALLFGLLAEPVSRTEGVWVLLKVFGFLPAGTKGLGQFVKTSNEAIE